jgi:hypothetical protein
MSLRKEENSGGITKQTVEWRGREIIFGAEKVEGKNERAAKKAELQRWEGGETRIGRRTVEMGLVREQRWGEGNCNKEANRDGKGERWEKSSTNEFDG